MIKDNKEGPIQENALIKFKGDSLNGYFCYYYNGPSYLRLCDLFCITCKNYLSLVHTLVNIFIDNHNDLSRIYRIHKEEKIYDEGKVILKVYINGKAALYITYFYRTDRDKKSCFYSIREKQVLWTSGYKTLK